MLQVHKNVLENILATVETLMRKTITTKTIHSWSLQETVSAIT